MSSLSYPLIDVDSNAHLQRLCENWLKLPMLAVDTEFMRTTTFYPLPALIQVHDGTANYLIDPLKIDSWQPLCEVLQHPHTLKVLHACSEDVEVFYRLLQVLPVNLLDTQVAAAFAGKGFSVGYSKLVEELLSVQLPKGETRSDWLQRPLTEAQRSYAAMDVEYLFAAANILLEELKVQNRLQWALDESQALINNFREAQNPDNAVLRFRGAWRLDSRQLCLLMHLARWRELVAQQRDVPRSYVIKDKPLYSIAEAMPSHVGQLRKVPEMPEKTIRRYGEELIDIGVAVAALEDSELPERLPKTPSSKQKETIKLLREKISEVAQRLNIAPEILARRKDYEYIVQAVARGAEGEDVLPPDLASWRAEHVKPVVMKYL